MEKQEIIENNNENENKKNEKNNFEGIILDTLNYNTLNNNTSTTTNNNNNNENNNLEELNDFILQFINNFINNNNNNNNHNLDNQFLKLCEDKNFKYHIINYLFQKINEDSQFITPGLKILRVLVEHSFFDEYLIATDFVTKLTPIVIRGNDEQRLDALSLLGDVAIRNIEARDIILRSGISQVLISILTSKTDQIKSNLKSLIGPLGKIISIDNTNNITTTTTTTNGNGDNSHNHNNNNHQEHDSQEFSNLITSLSTTSILSSNIIQVLSVLLGGRSNQSHNQEVELIHKFLQSLQENNTELKLESGRLIRKMIRELTPSHREALLVSSLIPQLLSYASTQSNINKTDTFWILDLLVEDISFRELIISLHGIEIIVNLLNQGTEQEQSDSFWSLFHMCQTIDIRDKIFISGAIPGIIKYLKYGTYATKNESLQILDFLVNDTSIPSNQLITESDLLKHFFPSLSQNLSLLDNDSGYLLSLFCRNCEISHIYQSILDSQLIPYIFSLMKENYQYLLSNQKNINQTLSISPEITILNCCQILKLLMKETNFCFLIFQVEKQTHSTSPSKLSQINHNNHEIEINSPNLNQEQKNQSNDHDDGSSNNSSPLSSNNKIISSPIIINVKEMNPIQFYLTLLSNDQYESIQISIGRLLGLIGKNSEVMTSLSPQLIHEILVTCLQILSNYSTTTSTNIQQLILELLRVYIEYSFIKHELHELSFKKLLHELHDYHKAINSTPESLPSTTPGTNQILVASIPNSGTGPNENSLEILYLTKELKTLCHESNWFNLSKLHL